MIEHYRLVLIHVADPTQPLFGTVFVKREFDQKCGQKPHLCRTQYLELLEITTKSHWEAYKRAFVCCKRETKHTLIGTGLDCCCYGGGDVVEIKTCQPFQDKQLN